MTELRVYLLVEDLQQQFATYMSTPLRARGFPAYAGEHSLIIEVSPALAIHRIADLALRAEPDMEPGILFAERQFGVLELHSPDLAGLRDAGEAILQGIGAKAESQLAPELLYSGVIPAVADQHASIVNRTRGASMLLPGQALLLCEIVPALFACMAANEAEKEVPEVNIVDVQMIGASGRVFLSGKEADMLRAQERIRASLSTIAGRSRS